MNASSRVLLVFRIATTVLTEHKLKPSNPFPKSLKATFSDVFVLKYYLILLDFELSSILFRKPLGSLL